MLSYREWKQLNETDVAVQNTEIQRLIDDTVKEIERAVSDFMSRFMANIPTAQLAPQPQASTPKPNIGSRIKQGIGNYLNQPSTGSLSQAERDAGRRFTRGERMSSLWNNLKSRVGSYFMKKEWDEFNEYLESLVTTTTLQSSLVECGVSRFVLSEANIDFSQLRQNIRSQLQNLSSKIQGVFQNKPASTPTRQAAQAVPTTPPGSPVANRPASFGTPPAQPTPSAESNKDFIKLALQSQGKLDAFISLSGLDEKGALDSLFAQIKERKPDVSAASLRAWAGAIKTHKKLWDEGSRRASTLWTLLKELGSSPTDSGTPNQQEPTQPAEAPQEAPEPPQSPQEVPQEQQPRVKKKVEDIQWRGPNEDEISFIKGLSGRDHETLNIKKLLRDGIDPKALMEINPHLRHLVFSIMATSHDKRVERYAKKLSRIF